MKTYNGRDPTGQQGEDFFLIEDGVVSCTQAKSATDPTEISLLTLGKGEYFGEMALMLEEPRAANCIATEGKVRVLLFRFVLFLFLLLLFASFLKRFCLLRFPFLFFSFLVRETACERRLLAYLLGGSTGCWFAEQPAMGVS